MWERFEKALSAGDLTPLVEQFRAEGSSQVEIYHLFHRFYLFVKEQGREEDLELMIDILDRITGWCSPHAKLFPHDLTDEEIREYQLKNLTNNEIAP